MCFYVFELSWLGIGEVWNAKKVLDFDVEVHEVSIHFFHFGSILEHVTTWWEPTLSPVMLSWDCANKALVVGEVVERGDV